MEGFLRGLASFFEDTCPRARTDRRVLALFALIVIAGVFVRFWGLGNVGLHGDEKTMALPTMHLLEHGTPDQVVVRVRKPKAPSGAGHPSQMPGDRERGAVDHLHRLEHPVAHGDPVVEHRQRRPVRVDDRSVAPRSHPLTIGARAVSADGTQSLSGACDPLVFSFAPSRGGRARTWLSW